MALKILKFRTIEEAEHMLGGGLIGVKNPSHFSGLVGQTITFTAPAGSKTFTEVAGQPPDMLTFPQVKAQLETIANLKVLLVNGHVAFKHAGGLAVTLAAVDQPARAILGLNNPSGGAAISGQFVNPPGGSAPYVVSMCPDNHTIYVMIEE